LGKTFGIPGIFLEKSILNNYVHRKPPFSPEIIIKRALFFIPVFSGISDFLVFIEFQELFGERGKAREKRGKKGKKGNRKHNGTRKDKKTGHSSTQKKISPPRPQDTHMLGRCNTLWPGTAM
jgi:hypothetical protein